MSNNTKERIFNNITETVGRTPMVRLLKFEKEINTKCEIIAKFLLLFTASRMSLFSIILVPKLIYLILRPYNKSLNITIDY